MNDLSAAPVLSPVLPPRPRVALLVDGENISHAHAGALVLAAARHGGVTLCRVYGNAAAIPGWGEIAGFRLIHSGTGKNATDLLLAVEAMALMLGQRADVLMLASCDRDFSHLATHLREAGYPVLGIGGAKAPDGFRKSCSAFHDLAPLAEPATAARVNPIVEPGTLPETVRNLIVREGTGGAMPIGKLGQRMGSVHTVRIKDHPLKTWRAFLTAHHTLFQCDPKGPDALVRLKP